MKTVLGKGGRLVVPAICRKALGLREGDTVILRLKEGELRILSRRQALRQAQDLVHRYVPEGRSLSRDLIAHRREEARHD